MSSATRVSVLRGRSLSSLGEGSNAFQPAGADMTATSDPIEMPLFNNERRGRRRPRADIKEEADGELVRLAGKGHDDAWEELVYRFDGLVQRAAKRSGLSDSDAADVAQVTWLRLMGNLDRLLDPSRVAGWLATTARREGLRVAMKAARQVPSADPDAASSSDGRATPGADCEVLRGQFDDQAIEDALGRLPLQYQRLLRLLNSDAGLTYAQIANALGISIGSIGPMRQRALQRLRHDHQLASRCR